MSSPSSPYTKHEERLLSLQEEFESYSTEKQKSQATTSKPSSPHDIALQESFSSSTLTSPLPSPPLAEALRVHPSSPLKAKTQPHYHGHRQRLKERFLESLGKGIPDYEILEILLFSSNPRSDTKPLSKELLAHYGSFESVLSAPVTELKNIKGINNNAIVALKLVAEAATRLAQQQIQHRPVLSQWKQVVHYIRIKTAHLKVEEFHLLFLDNKNRLIKDERQQWGTVNHTPVYIREVVKRALEVGASSLILCHNHPSGDPTPSQADLKLTRELHKASSMMGIPVYDHIIIGKEGEISLRQLELFSPD